MIRAECHLHTNASHDSTLSFAHVIQRCEERGITCLFVTDHNTIEGAKALEKRAPFRVIVSEEIATSEGEIIGYFLRDRIAPGLTPEQTIDAIRRQGGVVSIPHPFDRLRKSRMRFHTLERVIRDVDILEVFNSRNVFPRDDELALVYARRWNKPAIAVSDAHTRWEVGRSTVELSDFSSPAEFLAALQKASLHKQRSSLFVHAVTKLTKIRKAL